MRLDDVVAITGGALHGRDVRFEGLSTDSRTIDPGALFCAVKGPSFDGNDFLVAAAAAGAAGALSSRVADAMPCVVVDDTVHALQRLTGHWRARFHPRSIGVTGSNGKTTVKEMLRSILGLAGPVLATEGNLNNHIGVPLMLARLDDSYPRMVIEMGANHPGEIASLARIARPQVGVITVIAPAHLEGFGSIEGVARAKGELIEALPEDGVAVVDGDGAFQELWRQLAGARRLLRFGFGSGLEIRATPAANEQGSAVRIDTPHGVIDFPLALAGRHNVANAAAACAAAIAIGTDLGQVADGLAAIRPVRGRLMPLVGVHGVRILDDTYNANPESLRAALEVLSRSPGPRWLVLGDMGELGADADRLHRDAGELSRAAGVDRLWCTGELCRHAVAGFGAGAEHFDSVPALVTALLEALEAGITVLVKGSRAARMERVVAALADPAARQAPGPPVAGERTCC